MVGVAAVGRWIRQVVRDASRLLFPDYCVSCGRRLTVREEALCAECYFSLPFTGIRGAAGNAVERLFWGRFPIGRASAFLYYVPNSETRLPFIRLKYHKRPHVGRFFGKAMARDLVDTGFFEGMDGIVPLPLAPSRLRQRGYNQSAELARGISMVTGLPIYGDVVERIVANPTQTRLSNAERRENVRNIFRLCNAERIRGRHVLLVDDILTSGSTVLSCAGELARAEGVTISVLVMGMARHHHVLRTMKHVKVETSLDILPEDDDVVEVGDYQSGK